MGQLSTGKGNTMKFAIALLLMAVLSFPISAAAQSSSFTTLLSAAGQVLGLGGQAYGLGQQTRQWNSQPQTSYYQAGQPCLVQRGNQLYRGQFWPVQQPDGTIKTECVDRPQP